MRQRVGGVGLALMMLVLHDSRSISVASAGDASWRSRVAASEYLPSLHLGHWQAPNRAHDFRLRFETEGLTVSSRETGTFLAALTTESIGRSSLKSLTFLEVARGTGDESRLEHSAGDVSEWWLNQAQGVEHGWTIAARPAGEGGLRIHVAVHGATVQTHGSSAEIVTSQGTLAYSQLAAVDARLRRIPARLREVPGGFEVNIDDADAEYPLSVDPILTGISWTGESNQVNASFGTSVASAGDVNCDGFGDVIVGAPNYDNGLTDQGRAFVFLGSATGLSTTAAWFAEQPQAGARFGGSVSTAGDVNGDGCSDVVVGALGFDGPPGLADSGGFWVYLGSATGLSVTSSFSTTGFEAGMFMGTAVASAGDIDGDGFSDVLVGAPGYNGPFTDVGDVHLFRGNATGANLLSNWSANASVSGAQFGTSVGCAGDVNGDGLSDIIIGAPHQTNGQTNQGRVSIYAGNASGQPSSLANLEVNQANAVFGTSVAGAGDVNGDGFADVIVGAPGWSNGQAAEGAAFVYLGNATGVTTPAVWSVESNLAGASLGSAVAGLGDGNNDGYSEVMVGSRDFSNGQVNEGQVSVYLGTATGPTLVTQLNDESNSAGAREGTSVANAGDVNGDGLADVLIGCPGCSRGQAQEGTAFMALGGSVGLFGSPTGSRESNSPTAAFGTSVSGAGDVNGDGFSDVLIGAPGGAGAAIEYHGGITGIAGGLTWTTSGAASGANYGQTVVNAGDLNGDGYGDVLVGSPTYSNGEFFEGRAQVFLGSATGLSTTAFWSMESNVASDRFGQVLAGAGDVNGDGFADFLIGDPLYNNGQVQEGRALLFLGSATAISATAAWIVESNVTSMAFGAGVARAGDINGDGFSDVLVGAPGYTNVQIREGQVSLFLGGPGGLAQVADWVAESNVSQMSVGSVLSSAGDVNGDGFDDVIFGSPAYSAIATSAGRVDLFLSTGTTLPPVPTWTETSSQSNAQFGFSLAGVGDLNGDGFDDIVVGAPFYTSTLSQEGRLTMYLGQPTGLGTPETYADYGGQAMSSLGYSVAAAGDTNGDGVPDVVVGSPGWDNGQTDEGRATLYLGGSVPGRDRQLRQRVGGISKGAGVKTNSIVLEMRATAEIIALQGLSVDFEVKPLGTRFDALNVVTTPVLPGRVATRAFADATNAQGFHWRARVRSGQTRSHWVSFGGNSESEPDFSALVNDAGVLDAGTGDAGSSVVDAGGADSGTVDAGLFDAGTLDAGMADAGLSDGGIDAGAMDASMSDAGKTDAGALSIDPIDAGDEDAGVPLTTTLNVGCGCGQSGAPVWAVLAVLLLRRRRLARLQ